VFCASMADVFEDRRDLNGERLRLWVLIEETPWLDWQLLTKRPQNVTRILTQRWLDNPRPNVWFGTTVEDQKRADERIPELLKVPAAVRFISVEPLLGRIRFAELRGIRWAIIGGESGADARPMDLEWARDVADQLRAAKVATFVKQLGGARDKRDDPARWPVDLRVRDFPAESKG